MKTVEKIHCNQCHIHICEKILKVRQQYFEGVMNLLVSWFIDKN